MPSPQRRSAITWLSNQPYVLLTLAPIFWAGNAVVGRGVVGEIPPVTLSFLRWTGAFLLILPFAFSHLKRDWPVIRGRLGQMAIISVIGVSIFNTLQYWALEYTIALNALLMQSSGPLFIALFSLIILGIRLTLAQAIGIVVSLTGVLVILLRGDLAALMQIDLNKGDLLFILALAMFGLYSVLSMKRPKIHDLSFASFTFGCGALFLIPVVIWEVSVRGAFNPATSNLAAVAYVAIFPSIAAYLCYNRGIELIGANRAGPFFHLIPVFGSVMAIGFLGEQFRFFHLIGYALVLVGVFIAARKTKAAEDAAQPVQRRDAA